MKKILKLAYPYVHEIELDCPSNLNWPATKKTLEKNKVKLTFLENMIRCGNLSQREISAFRREIENERGRDINRRIAKLSDLLLHNGIKHLFPKFTFFYREHGDVDVLVHVDDFNKTVKLLQSHGYRLAHKEPSKARMSRQAEMRARAIADTIHLHSKVHWGLEFVPTRDIWKRSRLFDISDSCRVLIPSKEFCVLVTAAHAIFESHMICLADVFQIEKITLEFPEINWQVPIKVADERGWLGAFYTFLVGINAISTFLYDHTPVPSSVLSNMHTLCKPLDKIMGMNIVANAFSQIHGVPLHYPISRVGMFFIGAATRGFTMSNLIYPFNAVVNCFMKHNAA